MKVAESWKARIEAIVADKLADRAHDPEISRWLGELDEKMLSRLRAVGLAVGIGTAQETLGAFLEKYFSALTGKPSTKTFYGHTRRNLEERFGTARPLRSIAAADADEWRAWLQENQGLSQATIARRVIAARTIWRKAVRWKLVPDNPFTGIRGGHQCNDTRLVFVPSETIEKLISEAPDTEWKVIIALSRYGGLRCPSEHYALRWGDIEWEKGSIRVTCPKLAHYEKFAQRTIPLFPELRVHLLKLFSEAPEGTEYVISRHRLGCRNLRQQFERIIVRAGMTSWPRLFHNLRASRETELMREYDLTTVCRWIGNSPAIAAKHYAMSTDLNADFQRAAGLQDLKKAQQKAQQSAAECGRLRTTRHRMSEEEMPDIIDSVGPSRSQSNADARAKWAMQDSNLRPPRCKRGALTN